MNDHDRQLLQTVLKDAGYSLTKARLFVCELLWGREPQSMHDLIARLDGGIDRASLYRTARLFEQLGIVHRVYIGWKYKIELSDVFTHHHHHISCVECGAVVPIKEEQAIEKLLSVLAARYGFAPVRHQLEMQGYCRDCTSKKSYNPGVFKAHGQ